MADSNQKTVLSGRIDFSVYPIKKSPVYSVWLILLLIAFWGVWRWYFLRLTTSSEEIYGILALLAIIFFSFKEKSQPQNFRFLIFSTALILIYALTYAFFPPLIRAFIAVTSLTFFINGWRFGKFFHFGIWSLFLLSLPIVASLQFYFGYPMRVIIGEATKFILRLNGIFVVREGVCLHFGQQLIWIDAPCSGVKMLWAGFFLTAVLITLYKFNLTKSILSFAIAFAIILVGNIFRAVGLFYLEAEIVKMPEFAHSGIGVISFILTCAVIVFAIQKLHPTTKTFKTETVNSVSNKYLVVFFVACLSGIITPFFANRSNENAAKNLTEFPNSFENKQLQELELSEKEKYFLEDFPGEVKRFTDGRREIVIRFVTEATRKLHPSSDCFSAIGYEIKPLQLKLDEQNKKWSCFSAQKNNEKLKVCERIFTNSGESWTDVSAWYWSALSDVNSSGYWAITVAENPSE
ncbi:MAG: exosortase/archaeosortase family protein [Pyrinomonadaceae bacterium]|nr:exosortase/archaeosortase family protein [Pyrinomonadaceae bacterium]